MRKLYSLQSVTKCGIILLAFCDIFVLLLAMPTTDEAREEMDEIQDKIEVFKMDILNRLGYKRPPTVRNVTTSIAEKRRLIQEYRKYLSDREAIYGKNSDDDDDDYGDDDGDNLLSNRLYTLKYHGKVIFSISQYCSFTFRTKTHNLLLNGRLDCLKLKILKR